MTAPNRTANAKQFIIDRTLKAPIEKVWRMWTTKEGLEKWWGPEGFSSVVTHLDVRTSDMSAAGEIVGRAVAALKRG